MTLAWAAFAAWSAGAELESVAFAERARAATARYHDRALAIADGYRLIGRDFPGMGEHWIRVGHVFDGEFDPSLPEVLSYVSVDGLPRLTGVAFLLPLLAGEPPPDFPAGRDAWHDHAGTLDDETALPHHHMAGDADRGARLVMMHAWVWLPNPEGLFESDNWALPYFRLGLSPPGNAPVSAGKALSLIAGGDDYLVAAIGAVGVSGKELSAVREALRNARQVVKAAVGAGMDTSLESARVKALSGVWTELWATLDALLGPEARRRVGELSVR